MRGGPIPDPVLLTVGANHRTASLTVRDRLFVEDADVPTFLSCLQEDGLDDAVVIATCDRIEVVAVSDDADGDATILGNALARHAGMEAKDLSAALFRLEGESAVRHLFRVASSLDSVVVGEPQVLGQIKACHRFARDAGMVGGTLEGTLQGAYAAAKRVRSETAIGERPVSIAAVAVGLARDLHGDLAAATGLVLGIGDMGEVVAHELQRGGLGELIVADAGGRSAFTLAEQLQARHVDENGVADALAAADVVVAAVGGRGQPLSADMVRAALKRRRYRPQFIVDAALPRDVDPAVDRIDDAFLYDLGDLERLALEGRANRAFEAENAARIIEDEVAAMLKRSRERSARSALTAFREHAERLRDEVLGDAGGDADMATHRLLQKLLHEPTERMRLMAARGEDMAETERMLKEIFDIPDDGEPKP